MADWFEEMRQDPVRLKKFLRSVMGPERRAIIGDEYKHLMMIFALKDPDSSSNNQHTWSDKYTHDGKTYNVTYFPGEGVEPELEEILPDDQ